LDFTIETTGHTQELKTFSGAGSAISCGGIADCRNRGSTQLVRQAESLIRWKI
jgi:hypothetical protein